MQCVQCQGQLFRCLRHFGEDMIPIFFLKRVLESKRMKHVIVVIVSQEVIICPEVFEKLLERVYLKERKLWFILYTINILYLFITILYLLLLYIINLKPLLYTSNNIFTYNYHIIFIHILYIILYSFYTREYYRRIILHFVQLMIFFHY